MRIVEYELTFDMLTQVGDVVVGGIQRDHVQVQESQRAEARVSRLLQQTHIFLTAHTKSYSIRSTHSKIIASSNDSRYI